MLMGNTANGIDAHGSLKIDLQIKKAKYIQKKGISSFLLNRRLISLETERIFVDD
jgi:hypothetical protein